MAIDLGKQIGPLPLGAWIAVVGGGLGLAYYSYSKTGAGPTIVDDTGSQPGVGDGSVSQWTPTAPPSTSPGVGDDTAPTTNEAWGVRAINWLIAQGYDASESDSAIRKYLAGNDPQPSVRQYVLQGLALTHFGSPPQPLPPGMNENPPGGNPPITTPPPPPGGGAPPGPKYQQVFNGWKVNQWIRDVQKGHGSAGGNPNFSYSKLIAWNPGAVLNISWRGSSEEHNFIKAATYRIA
jgi:hypothetical protein